MSLRARCGLAVICVTLAGGGSSCSHQKPPPDSLQEPTRAAHASINNTPALSTFALYAKNSIHLGPNVLEFVGDIGVQPGSGPFLSPGSSFRAESGAQTDINWTILAGSVSLAAGASTGDVQTDFLDDASGAATHGQMAALVPLPAMPNASPVLPGTVDLVVGTDDVLSLTPGSYAHGHILGTVNLAPGLYQFADLEVAAGGNLFYTGPTEVRVAQRLSTGEYANLRPADGSVAGASDFRLEVSGTNGASGALGDAPAAATFGSNTYFKGLVLVPNGTVAGMRAGKIDGALFARDIDVEDSAYIAREGGFPDSVGATCATPCLPLDSCHTAGVCDPVTGLCSQPPLPEGTSCADGNVCNGAETCNAQAHCTAGAAPVVDDGNPCTGDVCDAVSGVRHVTLALGTSCSDGNACNGAETCDSQGVCTPGAAPTVDDHNPCTVDSCTATGGVAHDAAAAGTSCSDGVACNGAETCNGNGSCIAGVGVVIDDGNPCTLDSCDASGAAVHQPVAAGTTCSTGNVCSGVSTCDAAGQCAATAAVVVDDGNPCTVDSCDPITGAHHVAVAAGTSCSDGNVCNGTETCSAAGSCVAGAALSLDDGNPCTTDSCSPAAGVLHVAVVAGTSCSDGNACNGAETCNAAGTCTGSSSVVVDDGNPCTLDACDPAGGVQHVAVAPGTSCSDGNTCNGTETCDTSGHCAAGTAVVVDDGNPCTSDSCSAASGVTHVAVAVGTACSDGNACNGVETCNASGACLTGVGVVTDDGNPCTVDSCDANGTAVHQPLAAGTACSDGNVCSGLSTCDAVGHCAASAAVVVDDGNPCTVDSCDPVTGAHHVALAAGTSCSDGNSCNGTETCSAAGSCVAGTPPCVAADACHAQGTCDPATGVCTPSLKPDGTSCDTGNKCFAAHSCVAGTCKDASPVACPPADQCHVAAACDPATGTCAVSVKGDGSACDDGNACTQLDTCRAGTCEGGSAVICVAQDTCHVAGICDSASGSCTNPSKPSCGTNLPPDPATIAPTLTRTVPTTLGQAVRFLYQGDNPIQTGVVSGAISDQRVAVLKGRVRQSDGSALPGVRIAILGHPELGQTLSRSDGAFDLAVNGGSAVTVTYDLTEYLPLQRRVEAPWRDYVAVEDVVLTHVDAQATRVDVAGSTAYQVAQASPQTDQDGTRQATAIIAPGTLAAVRRPDGTSEPISSLTLRATEFTVGASGPQRMPGTLPPTSAYTYAVEWTADEVPPTSSIVFNQPVSVYVDNFLKFPAGIHVPVGYYDRDRGMWLAMDDGRVIAVLGVEGGAAQVDSNGDGIIDDSVVLASIGMPDGERQQIAALYAPGKTFWRVPVSHFTAVDFNWPYGPPEGSGPPPGPDPSAGGPGPSGGGGPGPGGPGSGGPGPGGGSGGPGPGGGGSGGPGSGGGGNDPDPTNKPPVDPDQDCSQTTRSSIDCISQVLHENVPVAGTDEELVYSSGRTVGRQSRTLVIPLTNATPPASLQKVQLEISIAGQHPTFQFPPDANQSYTFVWDGKDVYGRPLQGAQPIQVRVGYTYLQSRYMTPQAVQQSFAALSGVPISGVLSRTDLTLWREWSGYTGGVTADGLGLGGWSLTHQHLYDSVSKTLLLGDGSKRSTAGMSASIKTLAKVGGGAYFDGSASRGCVDGSGRIYVAVGQGVVRLDGTQTSVFAGSLPSGPGAGDGGPATSARFYEVSDIACGSDGSVYILDRQDNRIRKVDPQGIITTLAGTGVRGDSGDGGPATSATLQDLSAVAVGPDGSVYIAETSSSRIRRIGPNGIISNVIGNGSLSNKGDDGPASAATIYSPQEIEVSSDGTLYAIVSEGRDPGKVIRSIGTDGIVRHVAGASGLSFSGDGGSAATAGFANAVSLVASPQGELYVTDDSRVRLIDKSGIIHTVAGGDPALPIANDNGPARGGSLGSEGLALDPERQLVLFDRNANRVRRISAALPGFSLGETVFPTIDGSQLDVFSPEGRHARSLDATTGATLRSFSYDAAGLLTSITDESGGVTRLERDGTQIAITSPTGNRTVATLGADGYLASISDPAGGTRQLTYLAGGLLHTNVDPNGNQSLYTYDASGRLIHTADAAGGSFTLVRTDALSSRTIQKTSAAGRVTLFELSSLANGGKKRKVTAPDGTVSIEQDGADGVNVATSSDGTVITSVVRGDPRFGLLAPIASSSTTVLPSGLTAVTTQTRTIDNSSLPAISLGVVSETDIRIVNGNAFRRAFSASSKTWTTTSAAGRKYFTTLDANGRVASTKVGDLATTTFGYDTLGRLLSEVQGARATSYGYDSNNGFLQTVSDSLHQTVSYQRDPVGRPTSKSLADGAAIQFGYDANGNVTLVTPPAQPTHTFAYDAVDLISSYTPPSATGAGLTTYEYDADHRVTKTHRPGGVTIETSYDSAGRVANITWPGATLTYGYDAVTGHLTALTGPEDETLTYGYDGSLTTDVTWSGTVAGSVHHEFDSNFRVSGEALSGGPVTPFAYDGDGLRTRSGDLTATYSSVNGLLTGTALGSTTDTYAYNEFGEPTSYVAKYQSQTLLGDSFTRDALGRIASKTENVQGTTHSYTYGYDVRGRLTDVTRDGAALTHYTYDANGNRLAGTLNGATTSATYDAQDRMLTYGGTAYTYGPDGELASRNDPQATSSDQFTYDAVGNLRSAITSAGTHLTYVVDPLGRRVGKKVEGALTKRWVYIDGLRIGAELDSAGNVSSRFVYGGRHVAAYMVRGTDTYRLVTDHLGSVRLVVKVTDGTVVQRIDYDEFGVVTADTNPGFQPFGYAGGLYDSDTKLVRFGARDYEAATGRWTAKDPTRFGGGDANLYRYVGGDPVNLIDRSGRQAMVATAGPAWVARAWAILEAGLGGGAAGTLVGGVPGGIIGLCVGIAVTMESDQPEDLPGWKKPSFEGTPGSTQVGEKQSRRYGPDGLPETDVDTGHDHGQGDPHVHDWGRNPDGTADYNNRGPGRSPAPGDPPLPRGARAP